MLGFKGSIPQLFGSGVMPAGMFGMGMPMPEEQMQAPMPRKPGGRFSGLLQDPRLMMGLNMMNQNGSMNPIMQGLYAAQMMQQPQQQINPLMAPGLFG